MRARETEQGFALVGLIVAIFIILLVLGVAAPRVARGLRREREVEAIHRGNQYVRAVQLYYRKNGTYPGSIAQLEKSNGVRYLRQKYVDPMTGKPDWRLIHVGEAKTTVKGFFGKPLSGMSGTSGMGTATGMGSGGTVSGGASGASSGSSFGSSSFGASSSGGASSGSSFGSSSFGASSAPSTGAGATVSGSTGSSSTDSTGISSQSATGITGSGAPIMGVGSSATGDSITVLNEQKTYPTWEFIYDPRIEQLKAQANLLGGGGASTNATSLGSGSTSPGMGGSTMPGTGGASSQGFGSSGTGAGTTPNPAPTSSSPNSPQ